MAAWGALQLGGTQLKCLSYELGVVALPSFLCCGPDLSDEVLFTPSWAVRDLDPASRELLTGDAGWRGGNSYAAVTGAGSASTSAVSTSSSSSAAAADPTLAPASLSYTAGAGCAKARLTPRLVGVPIPYALPARRYGRKKGDLADWPWNYNHGSDIRRAGTAEERERAMAVATGVL
jgi:hypothetical protein